MSKTQADAFSFFLGTHHPHWLRTAPLNVPLFVSIRSLRRLATWPKAGTRWSLDSAGFTELSQFGAWVTEPEQYADEAIRAQEECGLLEFASPQDWMCEPWMLNGRSIELHQVATVSSLLTLRRLAPKVPWIPVLQGWKEADYLRHIAMYAAAGIDLFSEPTVGLGSVCRRQATDEIYRLVYRLWSEGFRNLHGFGMKVLGLLRCVDLLKSADSLAWSFDARRAAPLPGCSHNSCANCIRYALRWRSRLLQRIAQGPSLLELAA